MQTLGVIRIQLIYSINVLSKYSSLISHRPSIFEGRHIDHRSSIFEGQHIDLRRSTHRSSKVNTSISEGRHIDLRRSTHRDIDRLSSKGDTSIFESRHIDLRKSPNRFSKIESSTIRHRILSTTALQVLRVDEVTRTHIYVYIIIYRISSINRQGVYFFRRPIYPAFIGDRRLFEAGVYFHMYNFRTRSCSI